MIRVSPTSLRVAEAVSTVQCALDGCRSAAERLGVLRTVCTGIDAELLRFEQRPETVPAGYDVVALRRTRRLLGDMWRAAKAAAMEAA